MQNASSSIFGAEFQKDFNIFYASGNGVILCEYSFALVSDVSLQQY